MKLLSIVVPVFNEEESIHETIYRLLKLESPLYQKHLNLEIIFVDDGSTDDSLRILKQHANSNPSIKIASFSRNFGHQIAITAGTDRSTRSSRLFSQDKSMTWNSEFGIRA